MNNYPLVTIIVPIYNTAQFLAECIENVLKQKYQNWELLLINDGSSDGSPSICDKYALSYEKIKVIHKLNTGVSDSRNVALDVARGEYIIFLDSDDFWNNENILRDFVSVSVNKDLDLCCADFKEVDAFGKDIIYGKKNNCNIVINDIVDSYTFLNDILKGDFFLWRCFFKKTAIDNLRFNTKRVFLEDAEFYLLLLQKNLRCMYLPQLFYSYRKHDFAVTVKSDPNKLRDAFSFTQLCFQLSMNCKSLDMKQYLLAKGVSNYLFDIQAIAESKNTYKDRNKWFPLWNVEVVHNQIQSVLTDSHKHSCFIGKCSLNFQLKYFRYKYFIKSFLRKIIKK